MELDYKIHFKDKRITVMGLGLLGRGVGDVRFIAEQGAKEVLVTDLKSEDDLKESVDKLSDLKNVKFVLGKHQLEDFKNRDLVIKAAGVPLDSEYINEAQKNDIPIEMTAALFSKFHPGEIVGVTGTRGKTTVTNLIYHALKKSGKKAFLGGNIQGVSTLAHLPEATIDEIAVLELDSWQLQGFGAQKISPHIAVFTTFMPDHLNYYKDDLNSYLSDKANIFRFQKEDDVLVMGDKIVRVLSNFIGLDRIVSNKITASSEDVPRDWDIKIPGEHNLYNIACATEALKAIGLKDEEIKDGVESFTGVAGRLELVSEKDGIKIYNDTTATTPDATLAGLRAVAKANNVVLIAGGADKQIDPQNLVQEIDRYVKAVVLLPGSGTEKLFPKLVGKVRDLYRVENLKESVEKAKSIAEDGDVVLFSPDFASFGMFKNEYDRGEQFNKIIK